MGILVKPDTRVLCFCSDAARIAACADAMKAAGTHVVAAVDPAGELTGHDRVPLFDTAVEAVRETAANAAIILVPPIAAGDAMMEAIDAGLALIVCTTPGVPVRDMVKVINYLQGSADLAGPRHREGSIRLIGPGSAGIVTPGSGMVGTFDLSAFKPGRVAIVSRSNALAESVAARLSGHGIGQSTCLAIGGALISSTRIADALAMLEADPDSDGIVLVGGIGLFPELEAATFIRESVTKPVVAWLPGRSVPPGINVGADGDFASADAAEMEEKTAALRNAGVQIVDRLDDIAPAVAAGLKQ